MSEHVDRASRVPPRWAYMEPYYLKYADPLRRYVRYVVASRGLSEAVVDTEGVVHEAFFAMSRPGKTINEPLAWLFEVARNLVSDVARRHQHRRGDGDPNVLLDTRAFQWSSLTPQTSAEEGYELRQVMAALRELPDRQKTALYLHRVEGWSYEEIAGLLGINQSTVGVHIHKGGKRLREWFRRNAKAIIGIVWTGIAALAAAALGGEHGLVAAFASGLPGRRDEEAERRQKRKGTGGNQVARGKSEPDSPSPASPPPARRRGQTAASSRRSRRKEVQRRRRQRPHRR
ncbi:RNA polymerase sigma factor [Actinophytocola sp. NPDC049390]|uniref:RNA polymerase sigma factor n=1 Tax=Actinophytocola sp. NPDC049390 TaxID=3363894 RepID=UPI0037AC105E